MRSFFATVLALTAYHAQADDLDDALTTATLMNQLMDAQNQPLAASHWKYIEIADELTEKITGVPLIPKFLWKFKKSDTQRIIE